MDLDPPVCIQPSPDPHTTHSRPIPSDTHSLTYAPNLVYYRSTPYIHTHTYVPPPGGTHTIPFAIGPRLALPPAHPSAHLFRSCSPRTYCRSHITLAYVDKSI
ncbi:hypothetical protein C2E23DRAFT_98865 [Lenzites betulinus]|nr:hypothetical protein C2E23DRAFT_98865 [Lenzites betulinus]